MRTVTDWRTLLRARLRESLVARHMHEAAVLRETLAAIDNAEAPPVSAAPAGEASAVFAGGVRGLGAGEVARIQLSPAAVAALIEREIEDRKRAAAEYSALGRQEEAGVLAVQIEVLDLLMSTQARGP
jgi:uncharacterized protein YqeY